MNLKKEKHTMTLNQFKAMKIDDIKKIFEDGGFIIITFPNMEPLRVTKIDIQ